MTSAKSLAEIALECYARNPDSWETAWAVAAFDAAAAGEPVPVPQEGHCPGQWASIPRRGGRRMPRMWKIALYWARAPGRLRGDEPGQHSLLLPVPARGPGGDVAGMAGHVGRGQFLPGPGAPDRPLRRRPRRAAEHRPPVPRVPRRDAVVQGRRRRQGSRLGARRAGTAALDPPGRTGEDMAPARGNRRRVPRPARAGREIGGPALRGLPLPHRRVTRRRAPASSSGPRGSSPRMSTLPRGTRPGRLPARAGRSTTPVRGRHATARRRTAPPTGG